MREAGKGGKMVAPCRATTFQRHACSVCDTDTWLANLKPKLGAGSSWAQSRTETVVPICDQSHDHSGSGHNRSKQPSKRLLFTSSRHLIASEGW